MKSTTFPVQLQYSPMFSNIMCSRVLRNFSHIGLYTWQTPIEFNLRPQIYFVYFTAPIVTELKFGPYILCTALLQIFLIGNKNERKFSLTRSIATIMKTIKFAEEHYASFFSEFRPNRTGKMVNNVVLHAHEIKLAGQLFAKSPIPNFLENSKNCLVDDTRSRVDDGRKLSPHKAVCYLVRKESLHLFKQIV